MRIAASAILVLSALGCGAETSNPSEPPPPRSTSADVSDGGAFEVDSALTSDTVSSGAHDISEVEPSGATDAATSPSDANRGPETPEDTPSSPQETESSRTQDVNVDATGDHQQGGDDLDSGEPEDLARAEDTSAPSTDEDADLPASDISDDVLEIGPSEADVDVEEAPLPLPFAAIPEDASPGPHRLRRLTKRELNNTLYDLLGVSRHVAEPLPPDPETLGFDNNADAQPITPDWVERMARVAEQAAGLAVEDLASLLPCDPEVDGELSCGQVFIDTMGRRALRRPLSNYQRALYLGLFSTARVEWGFKAAIRLVLEAMLQSPLFLYRVELGLPDGELNGVRRPTPHEMAARLSYLLWGSLPDAELDQIADAGGLVHPEDIAKEAQRMIGDERTERLVDSFHRQWFQIDRLLYLFNVYGDFQQLWTETRLFIQDVIFGPGGGGLTDLLSAPYSILDNQLVHLYDAEGSGPVVTSWILNDPLLTEDNPFMRVTLDPSQRGGLLTQASFLSVNANSPSPAKTIIKRGVFILDKLLCQTVPSPPPNIPELDELEVSPNTTPIELLALHTGDPACAGCHGLVDPIGILFENYGTTGAWRDTYGGIIPVETDATLVGTAVDGPYADAKDLIDTLATDPTVAACYVDHWYRFAMGGPMDTVEVESVDELVDTFLDDQTQVLTLLQALSTTDAMQFIRVNDETPEEDP